MALIFADSSPYVSIGEDWCSQRNYQPLHNRSQAGDWLIFFHVYGKNGVMESRKPVQETKSHELGIVLEAVAPTDKAGWV